MTTQTQRGGAQDGTELAIEPPSSQSPSNTSDQPAGRESTGVPMSPGDEAPEGTPGTGLNVCPNCGGTGRVDSRECPECEGTGNVNVGIGGA